MSITHSTAARNAAATAVLGMLDAHPSAGKISVQKSDGTELVSLTLSKPSFGSPSAGVATGAAVTGGTATATGTATQAIFTDGAGTEVFRCDVATESGSMAMSNGSITTGDTVGVTSMTYTAQP